MALAVVFAFMAALGFSSGYALIRVATQRVSAPTATFFTVFTGAVLVGSLAFALNLPDIKALRPVAFGWFALMGAMAYPLARVLNNSAITMVGASRAAPMASVQPVFALILGVTLLSERPNLLVAMGTGMVVSGLILVVLTENAPGSAPADRVLNLKKLGYLLALGASAAFAGRDVISRHVLGDIAPPLVTAAFALAIGGVLLLMLTYRDVAHSLRRLPPKYVALCGLAGLFQGLAIASLFHALARAPVTVVSPINATGPLITLALAHIFLRRLETITLRLVVGTLISVAGVIIVVLGAVAY